MRHAAICQITSRPSCSVRFLDAGLIELAADQILRAANFCILVLRSMKLFLERIHTLDISVFTSEGENCQR